MTDPAPLSSDDLDLLASSLIDGESDDLDRLSVEQRDEVQRRAEELEMARGHLAEPVALPSPSVQDRQLANATEPITDSPTAVPPLPARSSGRSSPASPDRRSSRRSARRRLVARAAMGAAAVIVLVALGLGLSRGWSSGSSRSTAASTARSASHSTVTTAPAGSPERATAREGSSADLSATGELGAIGSFATPAALAKRVGSLVQQQSLSTKSTDRFAPQAASRSATTPSLANGYAAPSRDFAAEVARCDSTVRAGRPDLRAAVLVGQATLASTPVDIVVYDNAGGASASQQLIALRAGTCEVLVDRAL
jgi:hypothetical protein